MCLRAAGMLLGLLILASTARGEEFPFAEYLVAPLRVHLLASDSEPRLHTTLTAEDLARILKKVNGVWAQAGIGFTLESIVEEKPEPAEAAPEELPDESGWLPRHVSPAHSGPECFHVYYLKSFGVNGICYPKAIFVKDTARLRPVEGGLDEPLPRVTAHELGHALGLPHRQDVTNLMASGNSGATLNAAEIATVRGKAWALGRFQAAPELLRKLSADPAGTARSCAVLPLESSSLQPLREALEAQRRTPPPRRRVFGPPVSAD